MIPTNQLGETRTPDGSRFSLHEHDGEFFLKLNGRQLMSTTSTVSELLLADLACPLLGAKTNARVLIGGLGLGYSLKRVLELVGPGATVHVAELLPDVVQWNREFLQKINGPLLDDPRVSVIVADVFQVISDAGSERYDAILLDVDNGPTSFVQAQNSRLYDRSGFGLIRRALNADGCVTFWSAAPEPGFVGRLQRARFLVNSVPCKAHERAKRLEHVIYVAKRDERPPAAKPVVHVQPSRFKKPHRK
ncbi:MAG: spermine synthase [Chthoniobacterales bacterium]